MSFLSLRCPVTPPLPLKSFAIIVCPTPVLSSSVYLFCTVIPLVVNRYSKIILVPMDRTEYPSAVFFYFGLFVCLHLQSAIESFTVNDLTRPEHIVL